MLLVHARITPVETKFASSPIHVPQRLPVVVGKRDDYFVHRPPQSHRQPLKILAVPMERSNRSGNNCVVSPYAYLWSILFRNAADILDRAVGINDRELQ